MLPRHSILIGSRFVHELERDPTRERIEVRELDAQRLLKQRRLLHVTGVWHELPNAAMGEREVAADRARFEEGEAIVRDDVRQEAKGTAGDVLGLLLLMSLEIELDEFVRDIELAKDEADTVGRGRAGVAVELEDHGLKCADE